MFQGRRDIGRTARVLEKDEGFRVVCGDLGDLGCRLRDRHSGGTPRKSNALCGMSGCGGLGFVSVLVEG